MRIEEVRTSLVARLRARRPEIGQATLTRIHGFSEPTETSDPEYVEGLQAAVGAAIDYGIAALGRSGEYPAPIPTVLLSQARLAARNRISLDTVLRRYFAGYTLLGDFVIEEAERAGPLRGAALKRLLRAQAALFDRLIAAVSDEYSREAGGRLQSAEQRRADRIRRLLAGELLDTSELAYDFEACHLGVVAAGRGATEVLATLANTFDRRLLLIHQEEGAVWGWLGSRQKLDSGELEGLATQKLPDGIAVAIGEPEQGISGWRLTHRQAQAALSVAMHGGGVLVRYAEVALVASMLRDDLLATSLRKLYLTPLAAERDGGAVLRETLQAYFAAERNMSSAASALGVSRQTIKNRLHAIEERVAPLSASSAEMEVALRLSEIGSALFSRDGVR